MITSDIAFLKNILTDTVIKIVANKKDLVTEKQISELSEKMPQQWNYLTSAKTGENVEKMFIELVLKLI